MSSFRNVFEGSLVINAVFVFIEYKYREKVKRMLLLYIVP